MTPDFIASLQRALKARGHYRGEDHGRLDRWTRAGIRAYQKPQGLDSATLSLAAAQQMGLAVVDIPGRDADPEPAPEMTQDVARNAAPDQEVAETAELARQAELYRQAEAARLAAAKAEAERIRQAQQAADEKIRAELEEKAAAYREAEAARQAELEREAARKAEAEAARAAAETRRAAAAREAEHRPVVAAPAPEAKAITPDTAQSEQARRAAELRQALEEEKRRIEATGRQTLPISTESY